MSKLKQILNLVILLVHVISGDRGFDIVANGSSTNNDKEYYAIRAVGGTVTLGSSTTVLRGDDPSGDTILEGDTLYGAFDDVAADAVTNGKIYAYYKE